MGGEKAWEKRERVGGGGERGREREGGRETAREIMRRRGRDNEGTALQGARCLKVTPQRRSE